MHSPQPESIKGRDMRTKRGDDINRLRRFYAGYKLECTHVDDTLVPASALLVSVSPGILNTAAPVRICCTFQNFHAAG